MKRGLTLLFLVGIVGILVSSTFFVQKVEAQDYDANLQYFENLFTKAANDAIKGSGTANAPKQEPARTQYLNSLKAATREVTAIQTKWEDVYVAAKYAGDPLVEGYKKALSAAISQLQGDLNSNPNLQADPGKTIVSLLNKGLEGELSNPSIPNLQNGGSLSSSTIQNAENLRQTAGNDAPSVGSCGWTNLSACVSDLITYIIKVVLIKFAGLFVWFSASALHYSIYYGVLLFSQWVPQGLYKVWVAVRDIVNLAALFFGLGLIIMYLINRGDQIKRFVPWIIIYALFVNFSWVATRTVVDYSNIISLKIYEIAAPGALEAKTFTWDSKASPGTVIMQNLGLQQIVTEINGTPTSGKTAIDQIQSPAVALLFFFMMLAVALVFFLAAIMMIIRTVSLMFCIIFSPLLIVDTVLPWIGEHVQKLRSIFFSQLSQGVVFMILFVVTTNVMQIFSKIEKAGDSSALVGTTNDLNTTMVQMFSLIVMIIMLFIMIKVTWSTSKGVVGKALNTALSAGLTLASGGTALAARATLGAGASAFARSAMLDRMQGTAHGRILAGATNAVANSSFDLRNLAPIKSVAQKQGIPLGPTLSRGYNQVVQDRTKQVIEKASSIKDDNARESYLRSQERGVPLFSDARQKLRERIGIPSVGQQAVKSYREDSSRRLAELQKSKGLGKQQLYEKYKDLRSDILNQDRDTALAEEKERSMRALNVGSSASNSTNISQNESDIKLAEIESSLDAQLASARASQYPFSGTPTTNFGSPSFSEYKGQPQSVNFSKEELDNIMKGSQKDLVQEIKQAVNTKASNDESVKSNIGDLTAALKQLSFAKA